MSNAPSVTRHIFALIALRFRSSTDRGIFVTTSKTKQDTLDTILKYEIRNTLRNKWIGVYFLFFMLLSEGLFRFTGLPEKVFVTLMSVMIIVSPLISIMYSSMQVYNSREFTELLLSQPVQRTTVFIASFLGVMLPPALCFSLGAGIPLVAHSLGNTELLKNAALLLVTGALLSCSFSAIAFAITTKIEERARGFGASLMVWFFSSVMYDGILLFFLYALSDYPTERFALIMSFCNPIDLARITLSLLLDQSALMGYTGALYKNFFGSGEGLALSLGVLGMWTIAPVFIARRVFLHKDFS